MTQSQYDNLPGLIARKTFQELTGLTDRDLRSAVESGRIRTYKRSPRVYGAYRPARSYRLYFKSEVLKFNPITD